MTTARFLNDCPAPAKLNLFLHVVGRRADGYHLLQTAFQLIDYGDLLHFALRDDGVIRRTSQFDGVAEADDLVVRAAKLLQSHCQASGALQGTPLGVDIRLDKRLPLGGGLGGGSSNAATTLLALNHLWQTGLNRTQLMTLGLTLGADIPFFLFGQNAFAEGVGEALTPLKTPDAWFVVIEPGVAVTTPAIFSAKTLTRNSPPVTITDFSEHHVIQHGFGKNDLQDVAAGLFPPIADAIDWLSAYGDARMTGSGACVFCAFDDEYAADMALKHAPSCWKVWKASTLTRHPLSYLLDEIASFK
jgi:4-diphosphocytidyl-2-C-methyl-D-erythritol kinase